MVAALFADPRRVRFRRLVHPERTRFVSLLRPIGSLLLCMLSNPSTSPSRRVELFPKRTMRNGRTTWRSSVSAPIPESTRKVAGIVGAHLIVVEDEDRHL